ncbi:MAG TPA: LapA family protein [Anaerolineales bacterium]|nr:LapA family protein [Anaerolineales bacterium]
MATVYLIVALVIAALAVVFALQNSMIVTISFLVWKVTGSLSLVLMATLAIGAVIGLLVLAPSAIKQSIAASGHRKRIGALEKELDAQRQKAAELQEPKPEAVQPIDVPVPPAESAQPE